MLFRTKIHALRKGGIVDSDPFGNDVYGPDVDDVFYGEFRPLASDEKVDKGTETPVTYFRVFLPPSASQITAYDKLVILGQEYRIQGQPEPHNIAGRVHHYEVMVTRIG